MDNDERYTQFYTQLNEGSMFLYPLTFYFINSCLFPVSFNVLTEDNLLGRLTFFGFEQHSASLSGNLIKFEKAKKEILSILNDKYDRISHYMNVFNRDFTDFSSIDNQLVLHNKILDYAKHNFILKTKGTAPAQKLKVITKSNLHTITHSTDISISEMVDYYTNHELQLLQKTRNLESIHEALISKKFSMQTIHNIHNIQKSYDMLADRNEYYGLIDSIAYGIINNRNLLKVGILFEPEYLYRNAQLSKISNLFTEHDSILSYQLESIRKDRNLKKIVSLNNAISNHFAPVFNQILTQQNYREAGPFSKEIFSEKNIRVAYNFISDVYSTYHEIIKSYKNEVNLNRNTNIILPSIYTISSLTKDINHLKSLEFNQVLADVKLPNFLEFTQNIRDSQSVSFEKSLGNTIRPILIDKFIKADKADMTISLIDKIWFLTYVTRAYQNIPKDMLFNKSGKETLSTMSNLFNKSQKNLESLFHSYSILNKTKYSSYVRDLLQIQKDSKNIFEDTILKLFNHISERDGTILLSPTMEFLSLRDITIIDNFDVLDTYNREITTQQKIIEIEKEKLLSNKSFNTYRLNKISKKINTDFSLIQFPSKSLKSVYLHKYYQVNKDSRLIFTSYVSKKLNKSAREIITKFPQILVKKQSVDIFKSYKKYLLTKLDRDITLDTEIGFLNKINDLHISLSKTNSFLKILGNITIASLIKWNTIKNRHFEILESRYIIGKQNKEIDVLNDMGFLEKIKKSLIPSSDIYAIRKHYKTINIDKKFKKSNRLKRHCWIMSQNEFMSLLDKGSEMLSQIFGVDKNEKFGEIHSKLVTIDTDKKFSKLIKVYLSVKYKDREILVNLGENLEFESIERLAKVIPTYLDVEKGLKSTYTQVMEEFDKIKNGSTNFDTLEFNQIDRKFDFFTDKKSYKQGSINIFKDVDFIERLQHINITQLIDLYKPEKYVILNTDGFGANFIKEITLLNEFIFTELYKRWYFLPEEDTGPYDWMILPFDFPYAQYPEYGIKEHPILNGLNEALREIPVSVKKIEDVIELCYALYDSHKKLYARFTPEQAVKHFVNLIYDWLKKYIPDKIYRMPKHYPDDYTVFENLSNYREEYWRIYKWIRWYAESIILNIPENQKNLIDGYSYVKLLIEDLVKYFDDHHGKYGIPTVPESSIINKVKGIRHKWLGNDKFK